MTAAAGGDADSKSAVKWTHSEVREWIKKRAKESRVIDSRLDNYALFCEIDGKMLLILRKEDIIECGKRENIKHLTILWFCDEVRKLQLKNIGCIERLGYDPSYVISGIPLRRTYRNEIFHQCSPLATMDDRPRDGTATKLKPEFTKTFISFVYLLLVTLITSFVMVVVHNRVPDMKKYPPLPDIFLDNVPHIPWAFAMCEFTATLLFLIWVAVLIFHKHRFIILRRFFAISGTVFLLRCVTMLITSLSVPGTHLQCSPMAEELQASDSIWSKMQRAFHIWSRAGMSIQGVRTCGDYMFSGHTSALTILNFFITEYTPRHLYFMHTFSWMLNMFGIFFILSAHEHYSIDVFIAFYITSRLFLYYHTLANNQALMQRDSTRTRIWFPLFSFFESEIDGIIPNEFDTPSSLMGKLVEAFRQFCTYCYSISMRRPLQKIKRH